jgi:hypothetical protein
VTLTTSTSRCGGSKQPGRAPPAFRNEWDQFRPAGVVDATLQVSFDGQRWAPTAGLVGRQLSFESDKFPYRLTNGTGTIRFTPASTAAPPLVDLDVTARGGGGGGQPLHIVGKVLPQSAARVSANQWQNLEIMDIDYSMKMP